MAKQIQPDYLYHKYLQGQCSREELKTLFHYFGTADEQTLRELIEKELSAEETIIATAYEKQRLEQLKERVMTRIQEPQPSSTKPRLWPRIAAAASVIIVLGLGTYFFVKKQDMPKPVVVTQIKNEILPGGNKAYLTLGNGQRISLTDARNGTIANQGGKKVEKTRDGRIEYDNTHNSHNVAEVVYNTIETPRGGQYQIVLPDGSRVWLNAASSLRYPAAFVGMDRRVELTGEAYFEVTKDKAHPFKVATNKQTVEVLGTHFNINSYTDEPALKTTLLEGSVKITAGTTERIIKPGEQAVLRGSGIKVQDADEEEVLAWKNGLFVFNDESLESIMRKVSRWYDVDIQYGDIDKTQTFGGGLPRFSNVSKVLKQLESTRLVHFKVQGKVIYVTK